MSPQNLCQIVNRLNIITTDATSAVGDRTLAIGSSFVRKDRVACLGHGDAGHDGSKANCRSEVNNVVSVFSYPKIFVAFLCLTRLGRGIDIFVVEFS
jgi:hypothetical protein